jgi:ABC-type Fe3+/spermidine/putrescine transport system ATPase subunit
MHEALRLDRICKTQGSRILLHDVAFHLGAGEGMALVGPSGIGKTTLLRIVAGLETADSGDVWIAGHHATRQGEILVPPHRRGIGFVFQDLALWPHMTVAQGLDFVVTSALPSLDRLERSRTIAELLTLVQIGGQGDRYPHQLSGGEQQRAAFARALVHRPRLLLLDEPFSNLDAALREQMRITVTDLRAQLGFAMLFVTHDRAEATAVADRTIDLAREGWTAVAPRAPRWS